MMNLFVRRDRSFGIRKAEDGKVFPTALGAPGKPGDTRPRWDKPAGK